MENDELRQELVERYLDGLMTEQEVEDFETQLRHDKALGEALDDERLVRAAAQQARAQELRGKMRQWRQEKSQAHTKRKWIIFSIAAALILWSLYFAMKDTGQAPPPPGTAPGPPPAANNTPSPSNLPFDTTAKKPSNPIADNRPTKAPTNDKNNSLAQAMEPLVRSKYIAPRRMAYNRTRGVPVLADSPSSATTPQAKAEEALENADYVTALKSLQQADSSNAAVRNLTAEALFGAGRYDEAAHVLQSLLNDTQFQIDAHRNLVLCYLAQYPRRQEDYKKAITSLQNSGSETLKHWADSLQTQVSRQ